MNLIKGISGLVVAGLIAFAGCSNSTDKGDAGTDTSDALDASNVTSASDASDVTSTSDASDVFSASDASDVTSTSDTSDLFSASDASDTNREGDTSTDYDTGTVTEYDGPYSEPVELTGFAQRISMEDSTVCHLDDAGFVICDPSSFNHALPQEPLATLDFGEYLACGLDTEGKPYCWGDGYNPNPPGGRFTALAVGNSLICGIRGDGKIECFGSESNSAFEPPDGNYVDLSLQGGTACAIDVDGNLKCWGNGEYGGGNYPGSYKQVSAYGSIVCALTTDDEVDCPRGSVTLPAGRYKHVGVGGDVACGIDQAGTIVCRGEGILSRIQPPVGEWEQLSFDVDDACALSADGTTMCWGTSNGDGASVLECELGTAKLSGMLSGIETSMVFEVSERFPNSANTMGFRFIYALDIADNNIYKPDMLILDGAEDLPSIGARDSLIDGQSVAVDRVLFQTGGSFSDAGQFYCSSGGSRAELHIDEVLLDLQNLISIGGCNDGQPVGGTLKYDSGRFNIDLDGVTLSQGGRGGQCSSDRDDPGWCFLYLHDGGWTKILWNDNTTVNWAVYVAPVASEWNGAVYCTTTGSVVNPDSGHNYDLSDFHRLDCPTTTSSDSLSGCIR